MKKIKLMLTRTNLVVSQDVIIFMNIMYMWKLYFYSGISPTLMLVGKIIEFKLLFCKSCLGLISLKEQTDYRA